MNSIEPKEPQATFVFCKLRLGLTMTAYLPLDGSMPKGCEREIVDAIAWLLDVYMLRKS